MKEAYVILADWPEQVIEGVQYGSDAEMQQARIFMDRSLCEHTLKRLLIHDPDVPLKVGTLQWD